MKRRPTDASDAPAREQGRFGRSWPVLAGASKMTPVSEDSGSGAGDSR